MFDEKTTPDADELENEGNPRFEGYLGERVLIGGDGGELVEGLCARLAELGYETPVSKGKSTAELTNDVYEAVERFRDDHGVDDEIADKFGCAIGPATWAALNRAAA